MQSWYETSPLDLNLGDIKCVALEKRALFSAFEEFGS